MPDETEAAAPDGADEVADAHDDGAPAATEDAATGDEESHDGGARGSDSDRFDLRAMVRQLLTPMLESLDARLREQVETHADEVVTAKVDAAVADRLSTIDRAIADLSRSLEALVARLERVERGTEPLDEA